MIKSKQFLHKFQSLIIIFITYDIADLLKYTFVFVKPQLLFASGQRTSFVSYVFS